MTDILYEPELLQMLHFVANAPPGYVDTHGRSALHYCSLHVSHPALDILLSMNCFDINQMDCLGNTPLLMALQSYSTLRRESLLWYVQRLLQNGANPNLCIPTHPSPLMIAVLQKDHSLAQLLMQFGADPTWIMEGDEMLLIPVGSSALSIAIRRPISV